MEEKMDSFRKNITKAKRIVIKIGSSSLTHKETKRLDLLKLEKLVRIIADLHNSKKEVILVSSGAIAVGRAKMGLSAKMSLSKKQACAAIGQAQLISIYQRIFSEYNQTAAQVLMTKNTITNEVSRKNAENTFSELLNLGVIPIVNENDTVSTDEIKFGDNDRLSAIVAAITGADLLILLSDIDGLYTDDPNVNRNAKLIHTVEKVTDKYKHMAKSTSSSDVGTGGMAAKIAAASIATSSGCDMVIANGDDVLAISSILEGKDVGTLFVNNEDREFDINECL